VHPLRPTRARARLTLAIRPALAAALLSGCHPSAFEYDFEMVSVADAHAHDPSGSDTTEPDWDHDTTFGINGNSSIPCYDDGPTDDNIEAVTGDKWQVAGPFSGSRNFSNANADIAVGAVLLNDTAFRIALGDCAGDDTLGEGTVPAGTVVQAMPALLVDTDPWSTPYRPDDDEVVLEWTPFGDDSSFEDIIREAAVEGNGMSDVAISFDIVICTDPVLVQVPSDATVTSGWITWVHVAAFSIDGSGRPCMLREES
jgi:hypothetical protein